MTSPVFIQRRPLDPWHRLLTVGVAVHITACRLVSIDATSPVTLTATRPGPQLYLCVGAWPIVAVGAFGVLLVAAALGGLRWDGAP
jgi:hypothetical protein